MSARYCGLSSHSAAAETSSSSSSSPSSTRTHSIISKKKSSSSSSSKRRFSEDQIKLLESIFETESKLDPTKKLQLASELGLQPRQVAIWFQNRRSRSKSKHFQRSYSLLQANYDSLASEFEALKKENHALLLELQKLKDLEDQTFCCKMERECDNGGAIVKCEAEVKPSSQSMDRSEQKLGVVSDDDRSIREEYLGLEHDQPTIPNLDDKHTDGPLALQEAWRNLESTDDLLTQSDDSGYQWWDFWS